MFSVAIEPTAVPGCGVKMMRVIPTPFNSLTLSQLGTFGDSSRPGSNRLGVAFGGVVGEDEKFLK